MQEPTDADLIRSYRKGDEEALTFLVRRHIAPLYRYLSRMTGDAAAAEDLVQETFVKVWKNLSKFDETKTFKTWMFAIAKNVAIDHARKKRLPVVAMENEEAMDPVERLEDTRPLADEIMAREETAKFLKEALSALPAKTRSIILLHEAEDMTFQEIADTMGESMNTVKSIYRRALTVLRKFLTMRLDV